MGRKKREGRKVKRGGRNEKRGGRINSPMIKQDMQYWYNQYFLESSSICNTGITSIFQNLPVSAILIFWQ
jgi:hypothetical protein